MSPDHEVLYFRVSTFLRPLVILGVLICLSVYLNRAEWSHLDVWQYCALGALPIVVVVMFLLRKRMFIKFEDEGLTVHYANGSDRRYAWRDITRVGIVSFKRPVPTVALRLRDDSTSLTAPNKVYRAMTGYDVALPAFFAPAKYLSARIEQERLRKGAPIG